MQMLIKKEDILEMINIITTTVSLYDSLNKLLSVEIFEDAVEKAPTGYYLTLERFLESICNKEWNVEKDIGPIVNVLEGRFEYITLTPEQRLNYLLSGPNSKDAITINEIVINTDLSENFKNFEKELKESYNNFQKIKEGLLRIVCGEGGKTYNSSTFASIERSYEILFMRQPLKEGINIKRGE